MSNGGLALRVEIEHRRAGTAHGALCVPVLYPWARKVIGEAVSG